MVESGSHGKRKMDGLGIQRFVRSQIEYWTIGGNKINTLESISKLYMNVTSFLANLDHNAKKNNDLLTWKTRACDYIGDILAR